MPLSFMSAMWHFLEAYASSLCVQWPFLAAFSSSLWNFQMSEGQSVTRDEQEAQADGYLD